MYRSWLKDTVWAVQRAGIPQKRVTLTPDTDRGRVRGLRQSAGEKLDYLANNVSVTVYPVNEAWLYSLLWCAGVPAVSSDAPQDLRKVPYPVWPARLARQLKCPLHPTQPMGSLLDLGIGLARYLLSIAVVLVIFSFQKWCCRFETLTPITPASPPSPPPHPS
ncbi:hypothetical protein CRUP_003310 [Coryphaenoides rupestris]|nr:hypothetical protein CRUP_003310 [Coryphaenoides rupestris]